jgi:hypothetical protein
MAVEIVTTTEQIIRFDLGELTLNERTGIVRFDRINATTIPNKVREFSRVLADVAVMMENRKGGDDEQS